MSGRGGSAFSSLAKRDYVPSEALLLLVCCFALKDGAKILQYATWNNVKLSETTEAPSYEEETPLDDEGYGSDRDLFSDSDRDTRTELGRVVWDLRWVTPRILARLKCRVVDALRRTTRVSECARRAYTRLGCAAPMIEKAVYQAHTSEAFFVSRFSFYYFYFHKYFVPS